LPWDEYAHHSERATISPVSGADFDDSGAPSARMRLVRRARHTEHYRNLREVREFQPAPDCKLMALTRHEQVKFAR